MDRGYGIRLSANIDQYVAAMAKAKGATESLTATSVKNFEKVGAQLQRVGGTMTRGVTVPIVAAAAGAVKLSADFDTAFSRMVGLAGVVASDVDGLKESVLDLAGETGQAPIELANALYFASSAGLSTADAMDAVEQAARASAAGMGKAADVVGLVASAIAAYGSANIDAARATDILTAAVREGRADPEELAGSLGRVLPIASQLGITFEEVGGATAFLSNIFGDTNRTVTALQGFLVKLVSPSQQGRDALLDMGTSVAELQAAIDQDGLLGALDLLREHGFGENQQALRALFDDIEGFQGALALLNDENGQLVGTMDQVANSVGATDDAFAAASSTGAFKMKQAWAEVQAGLIQAGEIILPIVAGIAGAVGDLAQRFSRLPGPVQAIVLGMLALTAGIGPVILIIGTLLRNIMLIRSALIFLSASMTTSPLAGFAIAAAAVSTVLFLMSDGGNESADAIKRLKDLMKESTGPADALAKFLLEESNRLPEFAQAVAAAGIELGDLAAAAIEGGPAYDALVDRIMAAGDSLGLAVIPMNRNKEILIELPGRAREAADQLGDLADVTGETGQAAFEAESKMRPLGESFDRAATSGERVVRSEDDIKAAIEDATKAIEAQVTALEEDLAAQMALVDFARGTADAQYALADATDAYATHLEGLPAKLDEIAKSKDSEADKMRQVAALYRESAQLAAAQADAQVEAWEQATDGAFTATQGLDSWNSTMIAAAAQASGPSRQAIIDYIATTNEIPTDIATYIATLIEQGKLDEANMLLADASRTRDATITADADQKSIDQANLDIDAVALKKRYASIIVDANTSAADRAIAASALRWTALAISLAGQGVHSASGRYVDRPMVSTLGEGGRPEVVLPLSNRNRMMALLGDPRVGGPILAAMGAFQSAEGRTVNLTHWTIPAPVAAVAPPTPMATVATPEDDTDSLMANKYRRGAISLGEYRQYLEGKRSALTEFGDDEQRYYDLLQDLIDEETRTKEQFARDEADRIKRESDAKDAALEHERQVMAAKFELGEIDAATYEAYLQGLMGSFDKYGTEWMGAYRQIQGLHRDAEQAQLKAIDDMRKAAEEAAAAVKTATANAFAAAAAAKEQYDATVTASSAEADYVAAKKPEERAAAAIALAQAVARQADANANAAGLEDGSQGWARDVRLRLQDAQTWYAALGRGDVVAALANELLAIPSFAAGGYMPATPGGRIVRVADGGEGEWMVPDSKMMHASSMGGGNVTYVNHYTVVFEGVLTDQPRAIRELQDLFAENDRRNGRN